MRGAVVDRIFQMLDEPPRHPRLEHDQERAQKTLETLSGATSRLWWEDEPRGVEQRRLHQFSHHSSVKEVQKIVLRHVHSFETRS